MNWTRFDIDFDRIIGHQEPEIQREIDQNNAMRAKRDRIDYRRLSEQEMRGATGANQR